MRWHALALGAIAAFVYWLTGPQGSGGDIFIPLADAFWHGQLTVAARSWIELVPLADGSWAVPFPPAPALFYLPVVAVMGTREWSQELSASVMPALAGGTAVGLSVLLLSERLAVSRWSTLWIAAGFATTTLWWVAGMGGTHHMAQVAAVVFSVAALYLALGQRLPIVAGLLFALAVASRLPVGLSLPLYLYLYRRDGGWWQFLLGAAPVALAVAAYNFARFGSPLEFGYALIPSGTDHLVTDEPWYQPWGLESPFWIPKGLQTMFLSGFNIKPSYQGASILLTAPFLLWSVTARGRLGLIAGVSAILVLLVDLMHGNPGVAQFGYRFVLDATPVLLVCLGLGLKERPPLVFQAAVVFGAAVTLWGIVAINVLGYVS